MSRFVLILGALVAVPSAATADAYEASLHVEALAGLGKLGDPLASGTARVSVAGGAMRFTWATRHHLAYEVESYGAFATAASHQGAQVGGLTGDIRRGAVALGIDAGASLRFGLRVIPTLSIGIGPQLRLYPSSAVRDPSSGIDVGATGTSRAFDLAARIGAGLEYRINRRWVVGVRGGARTSLGIGAGAWRSIEGMVYLAAFWYPRWWLLGAGDG